MSDLVVAAMSGGVDSSVAAALLLEAGYQVVGATLLFRPCDDADDVSWCCGRGAQENARSVCRTLGIRHYAIDCADLFEQRVLRPSWETYASGRTPSPCILCNQDIKFSVLLERARQLGARYIATGHYARVEHGPVPVLRKGTYARKDQTYFLYSLTGDQLNHTLFPLGTHTKAEVRAIAARYGFVNAQRPESQDACFVTSEGVFSEALRQRFAAPATPGVLVGPDGRPVGAHPGIHRFTVGQRRKLGVSLGRRAYVRRIDAATGAVELTDDERDLYARGLVARDPAWTGDATWSFPLQCTAQIRYNSPPVPAVAQMVDGALHVMFETPQKAVAPGQAVVLYQGDRVVGGGWIASAIA